MANYIIPLENDGEELEPLRFSSLEEAIIFLEKEREEKGNVPLCCFNFGKIRCIPETPNISKAP